jgi:hypothetical protein
MKRIKIKTFLNKEVEIPVYFPKPEGSAWDRKPETKNCINCESFVSKQEAIPIINKLKKHQTKWKPPKEQEIKGICIFFDFPRILLEYENIALDCDLKMMS